MAAGKIQKFDPKAFDKMRGDIKQQQEMDAAKALADKKAARLKPAAPAPAKAPPLTEKIVFGVRSRRDRANRGGF